MQHKISQFKGLFTNANDTAIPLDYQSKLIGKSYLSYITSETLVPKNPIYTNDEEIIYFEEIILDDDKLTGKFNEELEWVNTYSYNPMYYNLIITKSKNGFYHIHLLKEKEEILEKGELYNTKFIRAINKDGILILVFDNYQFTIKKKYNFDTQEQEIIFSDFILDKSNAGIVFTLETMTEDKTLGNEIPCVIVPETERNIASGNKSLRFQVFKKGTNEVLLKFMFIAIFNRDGTLNKYCLAPYFDNKIPDYVYKQSSLYAKNFYKTYLFWISTFEIKDKNGKSIKDIFAQYLYKSDTYISNINDISNDNAKLKEIYSLFNPDPNTTEIYNYMGLIEINEYNSFDGSKLYKTDYIQTFVTDDNTEIFVSKNTIQHPAGKKYIYELTLSNEFLWSNPRIIEHRLYIKHYDADSYQLIYSINKYKYEKPNNELTQNNLSGIYISQTMGIENPDTVPNIKNFNDLIDIEGIHLGLKGEKIYYPIIGNGSITNLFYDTNVIPGVSGTFLFEINGDLGVRYKDRIYILTILSQEGQLLFGKKDELGFVIEDFKDIYQTPDGIILNTNNGIYVTNGSEMKLLSETINDIVKNNYKNGNLVYSSLYNSIFYSINSETVYIYNFEYNTWTETNLKSNLISDKSGKLFGIQKNDEQKYVIVPIEYEFGKGIFTTPKFNFNKLCKINHIYVDKEGKIMDESEKTNREIVKIYPTPLIKNQYADYQQISINFEGKIYSIVIDYDLQEYL